MATERYTEPGRGHTAVFGPAQFTTDGQWIIYFMSRVSDGAVPKMILNKNMGLYSMTDPLIPYTENGIDRIRVVSIDGLDPEVMDRREPSVGTDGDVAYRSFYSGRNLILEGRIEAGNLARLRELAYYMKLGLLPHHATQNGGRWSGSQRAIHLFYVPARDADSPAQPNAVTGTNRGVGTDAFVADFVLAEELPKKTGLFTQDFQITFRCPDPRFYTHTLPVRAQTKTADSLLSTLSVDTLTTYTNYGNADVPMEVWIGHYGTGSGSWTAPYIRIQIDDTTIELEGLTGGSSDYYYINSRSKYVLKNSMDFSSAANAMANYTTGSYGMLRKRPGAGQVRFLDSSAGDFPPTGSPVLRFYPMSAYL